MTAALLLRLAELYDVDVRTFAAGGGTRTGPDALAEIFSDPMLSDLGVPRYELVEIANNAPAVADAIARLYTAVKEAGRHPEMGEEGDARALVTPENWVRDYIQQHRNHYPELEEAARRSAARSAIRCRWPSRCGGGSRMRGGSAPRSCRRRSSATSASSTTPTAACS